MTATDFNAKVAKNAKAAKAAKAFAWRDFLPPDQSVDARERWRAAFGGLLGVLLTALLCHALVPGHAVSAWLVAPVGASAVLVFAVPASPFAQPWSVVGLSSPRPARARPRPSTAISTSPRTS